MGYFMSDDEVEAQRQMQYQQQMQANQGYPLQQQNMMCDQQGMPIPQQNMGYDSQYMPVQQQFGYNQPNNIFYQEPMYNANGTLRAPRKISKAEIYNYMQSCSQCSCMKKVTDTPEKIRHICVKGLHMLEMQKDMYSPNTNEMIPYYFCPDCRKLFVYSEFM